jgi:hypothetical protein
MRLDCGVSTAPLPSRPVHLPFLHQEDPGKEMSGADKAQSTAGAKLRCSHRDMRDCPKKMREWEHAVRVVELEGTFPVSASVPLSEALDHMLPAAWSQRASASLSSVFCRRNRLRWKNGRNQDLAHDRGPLPSLPRCNGERRNNLDMRDVDPDCLRPCNEAAPVKDSSHVQLHRQVPSINDGRIHNKRLRVPVELQQSAEFNLRPAARCKTVPNRRICHNVVHLESQVAGIRADKRRSTQVGVARVIYSADQVLSAVVYWKYPACDRREAAVRFSES